MRYPDPNIKVYQFVDREKIIQELNSFRDFHGYIGPLTEENSGKVIQELGRFHAVCKKITIEPIVDRGAVYVDVFMLRKENVADISDLEMEVEPDDLEEDEPGLGGI